MVHSNFGGEEAIVGTVCAACPTRLPDVCRSVDEHEGRVAGSLGRHPYARILHGAHEHDRLAVVPGRVLDQRARRQHGARHAARDQEHGQSERDGSRAANMARCPSRYAALFTGPAAGGAPATILASLVRLRLRGFRLSV